MFKINTRERFCSQFVPFAASTPRFLADSEAGLKDHVRTRHSERRPVHRVYNITTPKKNQQTYRRGRALGGRRILPKPSKNSSRFLFDSHVAPCAKEQCFAFDLSFNFSKTGHHTQLTHAPNATHAIQLGQSSSPCLDDPR